MKSCPHCGDTEEGWYANCRAYGYVQQQGQWGADRTNVEDTVTDNLNWNDTKWVVCGKCHKKVLRHTMEVQ